MKKIRLFIFALVVIMLLSSCGKLKSSVEAVDSEKQTETVTPEIQRDPVREKLDSLSLKEKLGQMFFITPEQLDEASARAASDDIAAKYEEYPCGGFIFFGNNIVSPQQLFEFTKKLHALGKVRPTLCLDEEGGLVARIAKNKNFDVPKFDNMQSIAASGDYSKAYELGNAIGAYLKEYGFDLDLAPVADVNSNPQNTVIGVRAFGSDPLTAGGMVASVISGLHDNGVMSCLKHYPGSGDTKSDPHKGYVESAKSWDELLAVELKPFMTGIKAGTDMIMAAHICFPNAAKEALPASLSHELLTDKLRGELGYNGVIITDAMNMGAIKNKYSSGEAAVAAIKAGADIILMPEDYREAFDAVMLAIAADEISIERIDESVYRILSLKQ